MCKPVLIPQAEFRAMLGLSKNKFFRCKREGLFPEPVCKLGVLPYMNRAECEAFVRGEWSPEWRASHPLEMVGGQSDEC